MLPPRRTIVLSSSTHPGGSADLSPVDFSRARSSVRAYDDCKLDVTTLAMALARIRRCALAHAVEPGWVPRRLGRRGAPDSLEDGHRTQAWLATADAGEIVPRTGRVLVSPPGRLHPDALVTAFQEELLRPSTRTPGSLRGFPTSDEQRVTVPYRRRRREGPRR